jgi:hypothetical protein
LFFCFQEAKEDKSRFKVRPKTSGSTSNQVHIASLNNKLRHLGTEWSSILSEGEKEIETFSNDQTQ